MDTCVRCGAELGVGRFCLNCGHPIGEPAPVEPAAALPAAPAPVEPSLGPPPTSAPVTVTPTGLPVQAADPVPLPPVTPPPPRVTRAPTRSEWDPEEDLLPYEEVDDLEREAPLRGRAWIAWVLGAVLLVGLVLVLLQAFGTDETATDPGSTSSATDPATDPAQGSGEESQSPEDDEPEDVPQGVGQRIELATGATVAVPDTAPPTTDLDGNLVAYEASQMIDGNPSTAWRMAGDASGQTVTLTLAEPAVVLRVGLVNGYTKQVAGVDWYPNNRRILAVTWAFDDGTTLEQTFAERPGLQMLKVPPVQTGAIDIQITSVTPPGSGNLGRDYTAISEVSVIGRRAG